MNIQIIQRLIDNKFQPNVAEWVMDVEDVLSDANMMTDEIKDCVKTVKSQPINWNQSFPEKSDVLVATMKRLVKKFDRSSISNHSEMNNNDNSYIIQEVQDVNKDVFIVYAHKGEATKLRVQDFVQNTLGYIPHTLDVSKHSGLVWDSFIKESQNCSKAIVVMTADDMVVDADNKYYQSRPNVYIELGYLVAKLQLHNVMVVIDGDIKIPTDINGICSVYMSNANWMESIRNQMERN